MSMTLVALSKYKSLINFLQEIYNLRTQDNWSHMYLAGDLKLRAVFI